MADYYTTGQITLTNGSASIVGVGTAWVIANVAGGTIFVEGTGNALPLDDIADDTHATASIEWKGASGTYNYALLRATAFSDQLEANSNIMSRLLVGLEAGTFYRYEVAKDLADKSGYDERPEGFAFLAIDVNPAQLFIKASATSGDWRGPFSYGTGPAGPVGPAALLVWRGPYNGSTTYAKNDGVSDSGRSFISLQDGNTGHAVPVYPATANAWWGLTAEKGADGTSTPSDNAVTNAKLADMATARIKGRATAGTGDPEDLTAAQVKALLATTALDVSFDNSTAGLSGSPATVQAAINALAVVATSGGKNDALLALEIADLKGSRMGMAGGIADAFDDETGVNTGGSTGQSYDASNDWYANLTETTEESAGTGANAGSWATYTAVDRSYAVDNSKTVYAVWVYSAIAGSGKVKLALENSSTSFDIVAEAAMTHPGGGWFRVNLATPFAVPATGTYRAAQYWSSGGPSGSLPSNACAFKSGDITGSAQTGFTTQAVGFGSRVTYGTISNMTLVSAAYTAASVPSMARVALQLVEPVAITINTDVTAEVSRDGGTTWTAVTLALSTNLNGVKVYEGTATISGQPSGTSMRWRIKTLNNKNVDVSGVVLQWS